MLDARETNQAQEIALSRITERASEHDPSPPGHQELEHASRVNARAVRDVQHTQTELEKQLTKQGEQLTKQGDDIRDILIEIRRSRRRGE